LASDEQLLPLLVGQAAAVPVGAGVLAAVVEEADVVVRLLERLDLALDEVVEDLQVVGQFGVEIEVHARCLSSSVAVRCRSGGGGRMSAGIRDGGGSGGVPS
jgi:hypothetical protein